MSQKQDYRADLLVNASATGSGVLWRGGGGVFIAEGTFGGATLTLQMLMPDGVTWANVPNMDGLTATGVQLFMAPPGLIRATVTGGAPSGLDVWAVFIEQMKSVSIDAGLTFTDSVTIDFTVTGANVSAAVISVPASAIADNSVALAKLVNSTARYNLIGRSSAGAGAWEEKATSADVWTLLGSASFSAFRTSGGIAGLADANAFTADQQIISTDATATVGPTLDIFRNSATPAANDALGRLRFSGKSSTGVTRPLSDIVAVLTDPTNGAEANTLNFSTYQSGAAASRLVLGGGVYHPSATGTDKGNNTLNFGTIYQNNVQVATVGANTFIADQVITSTDAGATAGPKLTLYRDSASPAANDIAGQILFDGEDSNGNQTTYATITSTITDPTDSSEDATITFRTMAAGALTYVGQFLNGTFQIGAVENTAFDNATPGVFFSPSGICSMVRDSGTPHNVFRRTNDGILINMFRDVSAVGNLTVAAGVVTLTAFSGSHWGQFRNFKTPDLKIGTVVSTIDEMMEWYESKESNHDPEKAGAAMLHPDRFAEIEKPTILGKLKAGLGVLNPFSPKRSVPIGQLDGYTWKHIVDERLAKIEVSKTVADKRVYGVFVGYDEDHKDTGDAIIHAVGASFIRVVGPCNGGDLLESAGDGTARVQSDDLIRSSTIGKVTKGFPDANLGEENLVPSVLYCG